MVESIYLFLIDYVETLMMHPILKGIELGFFILLWQIIGTFVIFSLSNFTEPLRVKMNLDLDYFLLILSCLTGCFTAIYLLSGEYNEKVNGRALRMISIFGIAFQFFYSDISYFRVRSYRPYLFPIIKYFQFLS